MSSIRTAIRRVFRNPLSSATVVIVLAAGIGANTAMFSIVSAVLIRPLSLADADRLVSVSEARQGSTGDGLVSLPVYMAWRDGQKTVSVAAYLESERTLLGGEPLYLKAAAVSGNFFDVIGDFILVGRSFASPADDQAGGRRAAILSYKLWRSRFAGDPHVIGRSISLEQNQYTIIGILRPEFDFPAGTAVWTPLMSQVDPAYAAVPTWKFLHVVGRLNRGVTVAQAANELSSIASRVPRNEGWAARVRSLRDTMVGETRRPLLLLMAAVMFVLLIACANVANLLIARAVTRVREVAIRAALGATASRLLRETLAETLLLALVAGVIGMFFSWWALGVLYAASPVSLPRLDDLTIDTRAFAFALALSVLTGLVCGIIPALRQSSRGVSQALRDTGDASGRSASQKLRALLVVVEIALSLVLLTGAGLLIRSFASLTSVDPGFRPAGVTAFEIKPPKYKYPNWVAWHGFFSALRDRVSKSPNVVSVALTNSPPLSGGTVNAPIVVEGGKVDATNLGADVVAVSPNYFRTLAIPFIRGRDFQPSDETGKVALAVVNERFARAFFSGTDPIGKKVRPFFGGPTMREVVGVVADVRQDNLASAPGPVLYTLAAQNASGPLTLLVRSSVPSSRIMAEVRAALRDVDPNQPMASMVTASDLLARSVSRQRFYATLMAVFAAIAILLATTGLYAVMSALVAHRRQEAAIRMALGARGSDIFRLIVGDGMRLVVLGSALGIGGALALTRVLGQLLFGVKPTDLGTFALVLLVMATTAGAAISLQAWRATRVEIMSALREQ